MNERIHQPSIPHTNTYTYLCLQNGGDFGPQRRHGRAVVGAAGEEPAVWVYRLLVGMRIKAVYFSIHANDPPTHHPPEPKHAPLLPRPDRHFPKAPILIPIHQQGQGQVVEQGGQDWGGGEARGGLMVLEVGVAAGGPVLQLCGC